MWTLEDHWFVLLVYTSLPISDVAKQFWLPHYAFGANLPPSDTLAVSLLKLLSGVCTAPNVMADLRSNAREQGRVERAIQ